MEKGLGNKWGLEGKGRRVHLLERAFAAGSDVGEDVGETLSGHCERVVGVLVVCRCGERNKKVRVARRGIRFTNKESTVS
jgi:hypothetical protein